MGNYAILIFTVIYLLARAVIPVVLKGQANAEVEREREILRQRIMRDPRNGAAYHELAKSYNKHGQLKEALQVYQALLPYVADIERFEVNKRIEDLTRDVRIEQETKYKGFGVEAPRLSHAIFCPVCGSSNPKSGVRCWECGQMLVSRDNPIDMFHDRWQDPRFRRNTSDAIFGVVLTVGLIRVCYDAPIQLKIMAIFLAFVVISWQVWLRVTGR